MAYLNKYYYYLLLSYDFYNILKVTVINLK